MRIEAAMFFTSAGISIEEINKDMEEINFVKDDKSYCITKIACGPVINSYMISIEESDEGTCMLSFCDGNKNLIDALYEDICTLLKSPAGGDVVRGKYGTNKNSKKI
ncbi:MAG TPA: hypothetical protein VK190_02730 [Pseudoneobacillus sp.]|jgi:hypothetical protein|nr:hypothetical protein [Pseudoneobacillus sp.]